MYLNFMLFHLQAGFDVFNALDLMKNKSFLDNLKFGIGDGNLQYYLYNWKCPAMKPEQVRKSTIRANFYNLLSGKMCFDTL